MDHDRIDESGQHERVAQIRSHLATFRQSSSYNGSRSSRKGILKEKKGIIIDIQKEKVGGPDKGIGIGAIPKGKCVAKGKERNGGTALNGLRV